MPRRSALGPRSPEAGGQPGLPEVGRLDDVVVDADDLRERRGAAEPGGGVVDQVGHGCSSVAANGTRGANDSSWARTGGRVAGPDAQDHLGDAQAGVVLELALVGDGAERDDAECRPGHARPRSASARRRGKASPRPPPPMGSQPSALSSDGREDGVAGAPADQGADPGLLDRLGPRPGRPEVDELAVVLGLLARPDGLHGREMLADDVVPARPKSTP